MEADLEDRQELRIPSSSVGSEGANAGESGQNGGFGATGDAKSESATSLKMDCRMLHLT
jgi:hypothetical protein